MFSVNGISLGEELLARPRTFDEGKVLDAAIGQFWKCGYEGTSIRDLADGMGIATPSIYHAFGDKRGVFAAAVERYAEIRMRGPIAQLEAGHAPLEAISAFFRLVIERSCSDRNRLGCLLINSAIEVSPHDAELGRVIAAHLGEIEGFLARSLAAAASRGALPGDFDVKGSARLLLATVIGIRVMARANPDRELLEGMAAPALALIEPRQTRATARARRSRSASKKGRA